MEKSTVLETLFGSVLTAGITAASFTVCLIAALALGALVAAVYMYKNTCTQSMAVTLALLVGQLEAFASFWASPFKEVLVFTLIIPVLWWRSLNSHHVEDEE